MCKSKAEGGRICSNRAKKNLKAAKEVKDSLTPRDDGYDDAVRKYNKALKDFYVSPAGIKYNEAIANDETKMAFVRKSAAKKVEAGKKALAEQKELEKAIKNGDIVIPVKETTSQKPVVKPVEKPKAKTVVEDELGYKRVFHLAPTESEDNARLDNLATLYPEDVYDNPSAYGGEDYDKETIQQIKKARGNPDAMVTIYRSIPDGYSDINKSDWVGLSKAYVEHHAKSHLENDMKWKVVSAEVPAHTLWNEGNDIKEFGYDGPSLKNLA